MVAFVVSAGHGIARGVSNAPAHRGRSRFIGNAVGTDERALQKAAQIYQEGVNVGKESEEDVVAHILGAKDSKSLSGVKDEYKDKIKEQIAKKAAEMEEAANAGREEYEFGVALYERGRYEESEKMLRTALEVAGPNGRLGGDIQLQLALSCHANKREEECLDILRALEYEHPLRAISQQAENLRFILEAPKLAIGEDERVSVPMLNQIDGYKTKRGGGPQRPPPPAGQLADNPKLAQSFEDEFWGRYEPPQYFKNRYVQVAAFIVCTYAAVWSYFYKDCIPP